MLISSLAFKAETLPRLMECTWFRNNLRWTAKGSFNLHYRLRGHWCNQRFSWMLKEQPTTISNKVIVPGRPFALLRPFAQDRAQVYLLVCMGFHRGERVSPYSCGLIMKDNNCLHQELSPWSLLQRPWASLEIGSRKGFDSLLVVQRSEGLKEIFILKCQVQK